MLLEWTAAASRLATAAASARYNFVTRPMPSRRMASRARFMRCIIRMK